jgi:hypothetical protein
MAYAERIARLALMYGECRRADIYSLEDVLAAPSDALSRATLEAATSLGGLDWVILEDLANHDHTREAYVAAARRIAPFFPHRADVLLHAIPPDGYCAPGSWSAPPFRKSWAEIRSEIELLRADGFAMTHGEINDVAEGAVAAAAC